MTGTWCTPEVEKALELGYEIDKIHEVWHFPETQTGLFASYVNNSRHSKSNSIELNRTQSNSIHGLSSAIERNRTPDFQ